MYQKQAQELYSVHRFELNILLTSHVIDSFLSHNASFITLCCFFWGLSRGFSNLNGYRRELKPVSFDREASALPVS